MKTKNQKNKTKTIIICIVVAILIIVAVAFLLVSLLLASKTSEENAVSYKISIGRGEGSKAIAQDLKENGIIKSQNAFYAYARLTHPSIKAGLYTVSSDKTVKELIYIFQSGKQESVVVSIPEGLTMRKIALILQEKNVCSKDDFLAACTDKDFIASHGLDIENFEGFLFPDTYYFSPQMSGKEVVNIFLKNFYEKTATIPGFLSLNNEQMYYVLRLASIVEREYRVEEEAPLIASVFTNRLNFRQNGHSMGLYSCATIVYIITDLQGKPHPSIVTYDDLAIDSPYNTYKYEGLPPTPISNPGLVALRAATNPPKTKYYFFRIVDEKEGRHHFSTDFDEHTETGKNLSTKKAAG